MFRENIARETVERNVKRLSSAEDIRADETALDEIRSVEDHDSYSVELEVDGVKYVLYFDKTVEKGGEATITTHYPACRPV